MARGRLNTVTVDVEVYLDDFDDDVLIGELEDRGYKVGDNPDELTHEEYHFLMEMLEKLPYSPISRNVIEKIKGL